MIEVIVNQREISVSSPIDTICTGNAESLSAHFSFQDDTWEGYVLSAVFVTVDKNAKQTCYKKAIDVEGIALLPTLALRSVSSKLLVGVEGISVTGAVKTSLLYNLGSIKSGAGGSVLDEVLSEDTFEVSMYENLLRYVQTASQEENYLPVIHNGILSFQNSRGESAEAVFDLNEAVKNAVTPILDGYVTQIKQMTELNIQMYNEIKSMMEGAN